MRLDMAHCLVRRRSLWRHRSGRVRASRVTQGRGRKGGGWGGSGVRGGWEQGEGDRGRTGDRQPVPEPAEPVARTGEGAVLHAFHTLGTPKRLTPRAIIP